MVQPIITFITLYIAISANYYLDQVEKKVTMPLVHGKVDLQGEGHG